MRKILLSTALSLIVFGLQAQIIIQRCDFDTNWESAGSLTIDEFDKKEGMGSLRFTGSGTDWFKKKFSQTKTGIDETGYLALWLFVDDVSKFNGDGQIEISSSGLPDVDEYSWVMSGLNLSDGWNELLLPISTATIIGNPDLNAISFMRIYQVLSGPINAKLDFVRFQSAANPDTPENLLDIKTVDRTTLDGKVMFGYQGWFGTPDDGSVNARWFHWGNLTPGNGTVSELSIDMWYDDREADPDERMATGYKYPNGEPARVYSAYNRKTVMRHMKWLRDYDLDGVMLQRFIYEIDDPRLKDFRDSVAVFVRDGSERYGRTFIIMWDGLDRANTVEKIKNDWMHLVDNLKITESPAYLHHRGRPLISLWGYSVRAEATVADLNELIDFFHNNPEEKYRASIKVGCNQDWIYRSEWRTAFRNVEVVSPWTVGRYSNPNGYENFADQYITPAQEYCDTYNLDFMPVNFAGFSWYNLKDGDSPQNHIKRNGGSFFWSQMRGNLSRGAKMQYVAMFDELDESTAMFKMAETSDQVPDKGYFLTLDADGFDLPSDWYLRSTKKATQAMRGQVDNEANLGTPDDGIDVFDIWAKHATCGENNGKLILNYPSTDSNPIMEYSIDGGATYPFKTPPSSSSLEVIDLAPGLYNIWIRFEDGSFPTDLGDKAIVAVDPAVDINVINATCLDNGQLVVSVHDNPYIGAVELSLDGGANFNYLIEEGVYRKTFQGLAAGTYDVWLRWQNYGCETAYGNVSIEAVVQDVNAGFYLFDQRVEGDVCLGSTVMAKASSATGASNWLWTGPNGFSVDAAAALISENLSNSELGTYTVSYTTSDGCAGQKSLELTTNGFSTAAIDFSVEQNDELTDPDATTYCQGDALVLIGSPAETDWVWSWTGPNNFTSDRRAKTLTGDASVDQSGDYTVSFTDLNGCYNQITKTVNIASFTVCSVTGIEAENLLKIARVYPNPNTGKFNLELKNHEAAIFEIRDMAGKLISTERIDQYEVQDIDISNYPKGLFLLNLLTDDGGIYIMRILKQ